MEAKKAAAVEFGARLAQWREARFETCPVCGGEGAECKRCKGTGRVVWTQESASSKTGVPLSTWQRWEQGRRYPGRAQRAALEQLMRVTDEVRAASSGR